jgi:cysteine synthase A
MRTLEMSELMVVDDITELVGRTPILRLSRLALPGYADVYAKLEYMNPGGSIKDRAALGIIRRAEQEGKLKKECTIVEATAGNTGVGLALIGVNRGYKVVIFMPEKFSEEKATLTRALGAEVIRTPSEEGMEGAIRRAKDYVSSHSSCFLAGQFENLANPDYHYETTGRELFEQMDGRIDAVVLGAGTGGTITGVARFVKERLPHALIVTVESVGSIYGGHAPAPHKVEGIGATWVPATYEAALVDEVITVGDDDAFRTVKELAGKEGVLSGSSGGAAVWAALQVAQRLGAGKRVATLIPDSAERYMSKAIFEGGK